MDFAFLVKKKFGFGCAPWSFSHPRPSGLIRLQICNTPTTTNFNTIIIIIPTIIIVISRTWSSSSGLRRLQIFTHIRKREDDGIVKRQKNTVSRIKTSNLLPQPVPGGHRGKKKIFNLCFLRYVSLLTKNNPGGQKGHSKWKNALNIHSDLDDKWIQVSSSIKLLCVLSWAELESLL